MSADNVTLLAFAGERRRAAIDRYLLAAGPTAANPPSGVRRPNDGTIDGRTDRRTLDSFMHLFTMVSSCVTNYLLVSGAARGRGGYAPAEIGFTRKFLAAPFS